MSNRDSLFQNCCRKSECFVIRCVCGDLFLNLTEDYSSIHPFSESKTQWMKSDQSILSLRADLIIGTTCRASVYMLFWSACSQSCLHHSSSHSTFYVVLTNWIFVLFIGTLHPYSVNHIICLTTALRRFAFRGKKSHLLLVQCTSIGLFSVLTKERPKMLDQLGWNSKWLTYNKFYQTIVILISLQKLRGSFS